MRWRQWVKENDEDIKIDVKHNGKFLRTISLPDAVRQYKLDGQDTLLLSSGYAIWIGNTLLTQSENERNK